MTEDWQQTDDQEAMLDLLNGKGTDRKFLLFACACCRRVWSYLPNDAARRVVEATERRADGVMMPGDHTAEDDFAFAEFDRTGGYDDYVYSYAVGAVEQLGHQEGSAAAWGVAHGTAYAEITATNRLAQTPRSRTQPRIREQADLLRDIFGNPFRPVALDPTWLTSTVVTLARGIYDERAFDRLPILVDALQDAGCENPDVLAHCRGPGPHVRGCWVVDLILGKS